MAFVDVWNLSEWEVQYGGGKRLPAGRCLKGKNLQDLPAGLILLAEDKTSKVFIVHHGTKKSDLPGQQPKEQPAEQPKAKSKVSMKAKGTAANSKKNKPKE